MSGVDAMPAARHAVPEEDALGVSVPGGARVEFLLRRNRAEIRLGNAWRAVAETPLSAVLDRPIALVLAAGGPELVLACGGRSRVLGMANDGSSAAVCLGRRRIPAEEIGLNGLLPR